MSTDFAARLAQVRARYIDRLAQARAELLSSPPRERMVVLAHNLAGSGATYGFTAVSDHALALETVLNAGEEAEAHLRTLIATLQDALTQR